METVLGTRKSLSVLDSHMSYLDSGSSLDVTVIFLHGNPTAAFLWRNVIPQVHGVARCLAPDLIGMGHSGKNPKHVYTFAEHYKYVEAWIERMNLPGQLFFVLHDWGSALGFHWCYNHKERVAGIAFMEAVTGAVPSWDFWPDIAKSAFQNLRSEKGEEMCLDRNWFMEEYLPQNVLRKLTNEEMEEYRLPFREKGESRRPTLTWPREIPFFEEGPQHVVDLVMAYREWLEESEDMPKLYIDVEPGLFSPLLRLGAAGWPNTRSVTVKGLHFPQEDSPQEIGQAVRDFVEENSKLRMASKL